MKNLIIIIILSACSITLAKAQTNPLLGKYNQNKGIYNPSLVGVNDYLNINMGFRQQWLGFKEAPQTNYLTANGILNHKNKDENSNELNSLKHGVGGFILFQNQGDFRQSEVAFTYATHIRLFNDTYISLGISPSIYNNRVDLSDLWVKDESNDQTYQSVMENGYSNTFLYTNIGISMYSPKYYFSYSLMEASEMQLKGNEETDNNVSKGRHHFMGGYRFSINPDFDLIPSTFIRLDQSRPAFYELGLRTQYKGKLYGGLSYRNDNTLVSLLGITIKDKYKFGYAYEHKWGEVSKLNNGSHEIVLGIKLFDKGRSAMSMW